MDALLCYCCTLWRENKKTSLVLSVLVSVLACVHVSHLNLVNIIETKSICASFSNLVDIWIMMRWWAPLNFKVSSRSQLTNMEITLLIWLRSSCWVYFYQTLYLCCKWRQEESFWFLTGKIKVKVTGKIEECRDAMLCVALVGLKIKIIIIINIWNEAWLQTMIA